ncbi:hypothetical protein M430DRAFT_17322 [Amorphotheca resinae ATCC 22711]|uniref:Ubiquitin 3 binding protein But2 C-terminal domain-containing protein n=1 Tax=Amorphotheca resinae ATCC 22711 TaxID=857342 RepID=A0A2T3B988_AMORE|nr:hypothetical protein M430DRAFT_17322 [Amorphotheca resinae ATCC 22711]PSS23402.1 hypothetical protein M430DRAFT_17322 [Amorphotheca resinae ATCC 22711]
MQTFSTLLLALAISLRLISAAPIPPVETPQGSVKVTLTGADNDPTQQYTLFVPFDTPVNPAPHDPFSLSISYVSYDHDLAHCVFTGVNSPAAGPVEADGMLGPPQTITSVYCTAASSTKC